MRKVEVSTVEVKLTYTYIVTLDVQTDYIGDESELVDGAEYKINQDSRRMRVHPLALATDVSAELLTIIDEYIDYQD